MAEPFPRTFYYANAIELFERLAHYGFYIGLALYLKKVVGMNDIEVGATLGNWRFVSSLAPIPCGAIADKIGFKRSLMIAFVGYASAYTTILLLPKKGFVVAALMLGAVSGGFMKPVITGTVVLTSPPGRQVEGFGVFYRMVNSGSVVGKSIAFGLRYLGLLRFVAAMSAVASFAALGIATFLYEEPKSEVVKTDQPAFGEVLRGYGTALKDLRFVAFLLVFAGYYFMSEQFYMTFPQYMTRHIDEHAPLELITLVNPLTIALCTGVVAGTMKRFRPITTMVMGVSIGSLSMFVMGLVPSIAGAILSGAIFAVAEMTFTPRFYDYLGTLAPKGKAGMYMGLAFVPAAIGAQIAGRVSGPLIQRYIPEHGARNPFVLWSIYAGLGLVSAALMALYARFLSGTRTSSAPEAPGS